MKSLIIVFSVIILGLIAVIVYEAKTVNKVENFNIKLLDHDQCDLQKQKCSVQVPELGMVYFEMTPKPVLMNRSLTMKVMPDFEKEVNIWIDFLGIEMDMGFNRTKLQKKADYYIAEGFLPSCKEKQMNWEATLLIKLDEITYGYKFIFLTKNQDEK